MLALWFSCQPGFLFTTDASSTATLRPLSMFFIRPTLAWAVQFVRLALPSVLRAFDAMHFSCTSLNRSEAGIFFRCEGIILRHSLSMHVTLSGAHHFTSGRGFRGASDTAKRWPERRTWRAPHHDSCACAREKLQTQRETKRKPTT